MPRVALSLSVRLNLKTVSWQQTVYTWRKLIRILRTHPMLVPFEKGTNRIIKLWGLDYKIIDRILDQFSATGNIEGI